VKVLRIGIPLTLVAVADLHDELGVSRELQNLVVGDPFQPRQPVGRAVINQFISNWTKLTG